jgi:hypothetical protein
VLAHVILLVVLGLMFVRSRGAKVSTDTSPIAISRHAIETPLDPIETPPLIDRSQIPHDMEGLVVDVDPDVYVPTTAQPVDSTEPIGDPASIDPFADGGPPSSGAIGPGTGSGRGEGPNPFHRPNGHGKHQGLPPGSWTGSPTVTIDRAVRLGLIWLCRHQNPDGSWSPKSMKERCDPKAPCFDPKLAANDHYDEGLTSLALLAFLGAGFDHRSKLDLVDSVRGERHRIGEVVRRGLEWLKKRQNQDGSFSRDRAFLYNEALATMAMSEAFGLSGARYWREPAQRAVAFLQKAQRPSPSGTGAWGWRYASRTDVEDFAKGTSDPEYLKALYDSDTSVTTWCVMALKSAQLSGLEVDKAAFAGAVDYCKFATGGEGLVGYLDAKSAGGTVSGPFDGQFVYHPTTMSALGMCIRTFAAHDADDPFLDLAAKRIAQDLPTVSKSRDSIDYYYWYYASLALNQFDGPDSPRKQTGKYWNPWNKAMVDAVLALQDQTERGCTTGGWIASDRWASASGAGPLYSTAMNVLTLEVYYRYPNAFGRKRN